MWTMDNEQWTSLCIHAVLGISTFTMVMLLQMSKDSKYPEPKPMIFR